MKKLNIEEKEIFSLLTSKQVAEISEFAVIKDFEEGQIIYDPKESARDLYILLEGEVSLRIPSKQDTSFDKFSLEIEIISNHGELFGPNLLFGLKRYMTRARVKKPSKIMMIDAERFLHIIRKNRSEFVIMSYLAKVYFQRYINTMKELEEFTEHTSTV
ncbi:MAG: cyclic nucleotide-binding domain-containing protein [Ignavibacteria bacterium]|nr:cyclic nucleotide-binding domain-containing protein [Ignavibacteria bacterium]MBT8384031.1 cyclic nucleotide-binding domain-containing protein [Ignavibacteria bacterium]MBT8392260.1 cyclic nucleotide-binding domain-containing protein [Ignavibacteria bacterium]NNJ52503.1 cyclic nucleotide-binding domain-containing protein [Ignavibacteriaceae bacterium]NNL21789.1 cyclic nucleotide-binding domain-containing protein [Ignavibacteriaceae bacterium]